MLIVSHDKVARRDQHEKLPLVENILNNLIISSYGIILKISVISNAMSSVVLPINYDIAVKQN